MLPSSRDLRPSVLLENGAGGERKVRKHTRLPENRSCHPIRATPWGSTSRTEDESLGADLCSPSIAHCMKRQLQVAWVELQQVQGHPQQKVMANNDRNGNDYGCLE